MGRAGSMNTIYRSVPPRPLSYTFSDVLQASLEPRTPGRLKKTRSKTAPVSTNAPEEYAERFKSRPTTRPAVIDFNGTGVKMYSGSGTGCRRLNKPGFPAVKTRNVVPIIAKPKTPTPAPTLLPQPLTERGTTATSSLHLAPLAKGSEPDSALSLQTRPYGPPPLPVHTTTPKPSKTPELSRFHGVRSAASSVKSRGKSSCSSRPGRVQTAGGAAEQQGKSAGTSSAHRLTTADHSDGQWPELSSSKLSTLDAAVTFSISPRGIGDQLCFPEALAHSDDYDDLSELPRPKRILPRRDLPWVFRFKVKKEMNTLSKIMASKPSPSNSISTPGPMA